MWDDMNCRPDRHHLCFSHQRALACRHPVSIMTPRSLTVRFALFRRRHVPRDAQDIGANVAKYYYTHAFENTEIFIPRPVYNIYLLHFICTDKRLNRVGLRSGPTGQLLRSATRIIGNTGPVNSGFYTQIIYPKSISNLGTRI